VAPGAGPVGILNGGTKMELTVRTRTLAGMSRSILQRRLVDVAERLKRVRAELAVATEQQQFLEEESEEVRLRALLSETPLAEAEAREARRHAEAMARHRQALESTLAELLGEQDALLDRMANEVSSQP
jgi:chromosome segregation ATPase